MDCTVKKILCFGDSNTWGYHALGRRFPLAVRWPASVRWPDQLGNILGNGFQVMNEGLCGRTAGHWGDESLDGPDALSALTKKEHPDWTCIMLGSNDLTEGRCTSLQDLGICLDSLLSTVHQPAHVLLISPIRIRPNTDPSWQLIPEASVLSAQFAPLYRETAERYGFQFLDASLHAEPNGPDGIHMNADGHRKLAEAVSSIILSH